MNEATPLTFTDEQLVAAIKVAPEQIQSSVAIIAMQMELAQRRADDTDEED
jgi:hypothetical protein